MGRLFIRIFLFFWIGSTCLLVGLAFGMWILQPNIVGSFMFIRQSAMLHVGSQAASAYETGGAGGVSQFLEEVRAKAGFRIWLYGPDGSLLGGPPEVTNPGELVSLAMANGEEERNGTGWLRPTIVAGRVSSPSGRNYVLLWEGPLQLSQLLSPAVFSIRLVIVLLTGGLACWWLTRQITQPIRILRSSAARYAQGDLGVRVGNLKEFRRRDELSELGRDFDYMANRIEELMKAQQQLLADISHELRSPLARLSLALDLARRRIGENVPEHQRMEREISRLNELIEQLLTLARLQEQSKRPQLEAVNLRDLVNEVAADAAFEAEAAGRDVIVSRSCEATVNGSRALLRSALENVVRNAVRHTAQATAVTIEMERLNGSRDRNRLRVAVRDHGPGVPPQALDRLFDPFFRVDEGRDRKSGGVGLGLAITRQAMATHGGSAVAHNHPDGGLVIRLELPVRPADDSLQN